MSAIKKNLFSAFTIILFVIIGIASNSSKKVFKNEENWIPEDFDPAKTTLLVQEFTVSDKAQGQMEDYMAEKYPYKYEFVSRSQIFNQEGKYANTQLYKYALVISSGTSTTTKSGGASTSGGLTVTSYDFNFFDRSAVKHYPKTRRASSYAITTFKPVINTIVKKFE